MEHNACKFGPRAIHVWAKNASSIAASGEMPHLVTTVVFTCFYIVEVVSRPKGLLRTKLVWRPKSMCCVGFA